MSTVSEMMGYGEKASSLGMWTYSPLEGGISPPSYQLNMTVSAKVDNLSSKAAKKLVTFMKSNLGYGECVIDKQSNTIYVESITGVDSSKVLKYIEHHIDGNAR